MKGKEFTEGISAFENFIKDVGLLARDPERIARMKKRAIDNPYILLGPTLEEYFSSGSKLENFSEPEN